MVACIQILYLWSWPLLFLFLFGIIAHQLSSSLDLFVVVEKFTPSLDIRHAFVHPCSLYHIVVSVCTSSMDGTPPAPPPFFVWQVYHDNLNDEWWYSMPRLEVNLTFECILVWQLTTLISVSHCDSFCFVLVTTLTMTIVVEEQHPRSGWCLFFA